MLTLIFMCVCYIGILESLIYLEYYKAKPNWEKIFHKTLLARLQRAKSLEYALTRNHSLEGTCVDGVFSHVKALKTKHEHLSKALMPVLLEHSQTQHYIDTMRGYNNTPDLEPLLDDFFVRTKVIELLTADPNADVAASMATIYANNNTLITRLKELTK